MVELRIRTGETVLIDDDDMPLVSGFSWRSKTNDKGSSSVCGQSPAGSGLPRIVQLHRLIMGIDGPDVDHINGDVFDNRRCNLRHCSKAQNNANRGRTKNNRSGFKGVYWHKTKRAWQAEIEALGRRHRLGSYPDPTEAAKAYDDAAKRLHGEFARLNFPEAA